MEIQSSYKSFLKNINRIEIRYPEAAFTVLLFGFYELLLSDIIKLEVDEKQKFMLYRIGSTDNEFYQLLLRPIEKMESKISLNKYVTRIGIYGYYLTNIFSKYSIKKVIMRDLKSKNFISIKNLLFIKNIVINEDIKSLLKSYEDIVERKNLELLVKEKTKLDESSFTKFIEIIETELSRSVNPMGWGINSLGK